MGVRNKNGRRKKTRARKRGNCDEFVDYRLMRPSHVKHSTQLRMRFLNFGYNIILLQLYYLQTLQNTIDTIRIQYSTQTINTLFSTHHFDSIKKAKHLPANVLDVIILIEMICIGMNSNFMYV